MPSFEEIFPYVLAPVIVFLIQFIIIKIFTKPESLIWIRFLRGTDKIINETLSKFETIKSTNNKWIENLKPIIPFIAYSVILILLTIMWFWSGNLYNSMVSINMSVSIVTLIAGFLLIVYIDKIKIGNLLNKSKEINNYYSIINLSFFGIIVFILPSIYETIINSNNIPASDLEKIYSMYFISIIFIIMTMVILFSNFRTLFFGRLKSEINKLYTKDFPTVNISTNAEILKGKIHNIFDENLIILDDDGVMKGTQWKDIIVITIDHNPVLEE
ncbi:MAG: hypothetical protein KAT05_17755 [Spirochaetes bacterium]|nr:hypothetical protein [Spirochaetota bacterium]